jgi:hypothetical protein
MRPPVRADVAIAYDLPEQLQIPPHSGVPKNSLQTNSVLVFALILFAVVGASEAGLFQ